MRRKGTGQEGKGGEIAYTTRREGRVGPWSSQDTLNPFQFRCFCCALTQTYYVAYTRKFQEYDFFAIIADESGNFCTVKNVSL